MSDTPRTDQYVKMRASLAYCVERDTSDFARILERERNQARQERDELLARIEKCLPHMPNMEPVGAAKYSAHNIASWELRQFIEKLKEPKSEGV